MIQSQVAKQLTEHLSSLRAETGVEDDINIYNEVDMSYGSQMELQFDESDFCYAKINSNDLKSIPDDMFEELIDIVTSSNKDSAITAKSYNDFYQQIADAAKQWTQKPNDKRKIKEAIEYVHQLALQSKPVDSKLSARLKHDDNIRIISDLINHLNK